MPGRFVPEHVSMDEVDDAWSRACERNPRLFDGPLWHVAGVSRNGHGGVSLHVIESSYRFHAVRVVDVETGVRPLGVKAITWRGGRVLLGKRSLGVHSEPGRWEFIPGGALTPGRTPSDETARELHEEAGWRCVRAPIAAALIFDDRTLTWDIVHHVDGEPMSSVDAGSAAATGDAWETDELVEVAPEEIASRSLSRAAELMLPLVRERIRATVRESSA